jgi:drug/metabolite transporter (DMT)-like permease
MLWWFFIAIGMGLFGTSYMALNMFSAGNMGAGLLFGIGFCFGWFKTYQTCNDVLTDSLTRTILSILLIIVTIFVFFGLVYIIHSHKVV